MKDLEKYEKDYLERLKKKSEKDPKPKQTEHYEEVLEPLDFMIMGFISFAILLATELSEFKADIW